MSDHLDTEELSGKYAKPGKVGIKHPRFCGPGRTNGVSHAKNKARKKAQYLKNRQARAEFYSSNTGSRGWQTPGQWHSFIVGLSKGTVG